VHHVLQPGNAAGTIRMEFEETVPISTHLLAFINLPDKLPERKLVTYFARAGDVRYCSVNGERNQGLVFFETVDFAQTAISDLKSKPFQGRRLQVRFFVVVVLFFVVENLGFVVLFRSYRKLELFVVVFRIWVCFLSKVLS